MAQFFVSEWQKTETQTSILLDYLPSAQRSFLPGRLPSVLTDVQISSVSSFQTSFLHLFLSDVRTNVFLSFCPSFSSEVIFLLTFVCSL